jgi:hypothetical protein
MVELNFVMIVKLLAVLGVALGWETSAHTFLGEARASDTKSKALKGAKAPLAKVL